MLVSVIRFRCNETVVVVDIIIASVHALRSALSLSLSLSSTSTAAAPCQGRSLAKMERARDGGDAIRRRAHLVDDAIDPAQQQNGADVRLGVALGRPLVPLRRLHVREHVRRRLGKEKQQQKKYKEKKKKS